MEEAEESIKKLKLGKSARVSDLVQNKINVLHIKREKSIDPGSFFLVPDPKQ